MTIPDQWISDSVVTAHRVNAFSFILMVLSLVFGMLSLAEYTERKYVEKNGKEPFTRRSEYK